MKMIQVAPLNRVLITFVAAVLVACADLNQVSNPPSRLPIPPAPAPVTAAPAPVTAAPDLQKVAYAQDVFFNAGSFVLKPEAKDKLNNFASNTRINPEVIIAVGHTDSVGSDAYNQKLSIQRANAVKAYLVSRGVEKNLIYVEGKGEKQPIADNKIAASRAKNNRVEIEVVGTRTNGDSAEPWKADDTIPVLFATNRQRTGNDNPYYFYGNQLIDEPYSKNLRRGIAVIKVPPKRARGEIQRPGWVKVTLERISSHPVANAIGIKPIPPADLLTEFSYAQKIEELTASEFGAELKIAVSKSKSKTAVLYVHGYANDFTGAAFRAAQIAFDLATPNYDLVPLMFSWPSDVGITGMNYDEARKRSQASGYDLAHFLSEVAATTDIGTVHIIAHSMGAEVLGHAMMKLGVSEIGVVQVNKSVRPIFRQIVFAAPDVTPRIFEDVIEPAIRTNHLITMYGATTDLPLWLSTIQNRQARQGSVSANVRLPGCVDTVDVTAVAEKGLSHSTWAESPRVLDDLRLVLRDGLEPSLRGLTKRRISGRSVWNLPAVALVGTGAVAFPVSPICGLGRR